MQAWKTGNEACCHGLWHDNTQLSRWGGIIPPWMSLENQSNNPLCSTRQADWFEQLNITTTTNNRSFHEPDFPLTSDITACPQVRYIQRYPDVHTKALLNTNWIMSAGKNKLFLIGVACKIKQHQEVRRKIIIFIVSFEDTTGSDGAIALKRRLSFSQIVPAGLFFWGGGEQEHLSTYKYQWRGGCRYTQWLSDSLLALFKSNQYSDPSELCKRKMVQPYNFTLTFL